MKRENQLTGIGQFLVAVGLLAFLPSLFDRELLIVAWLGSWQQPVGLSTIVVGGVLYGIGKLQVFRNLGPTAAPAVDDVMRGVEGAPQLAQPNVLSNQVAPERADRP